LQLNGTEIMQLGLLATLSAAYGETCDRVERLRRYLSTDRGIAANQNAVLCFAGLLVLPTPGALLLVLLVYAHNLVRVRRHRSTRIYREVFVTATVLLGTVAGCAVYHGLGGQLQNVGPRQALVIGLTLLTFSASSFVVLLAGIYVSVRPPTVRALLPPRDQVSYELATLLLGVLAGVIVLRTPWLSPILLVLAAMFHRSSLVRQLQSAATTDAKTGLLNFGAWRAAAVTELDRSLRTGTPAVALLVDLDHFKRINDQYGHLAGDATLVAVGHALTQELRGYDAVGRYGGEEFAAFLAGVELDAGIAIAHRIRTRIAALTPREGVQVTASIGVAEVAGSASLDELIGRADAALYRAKEAGRNRVRVSEDAVPAQGPQDERRDRG
jgi:diguanylate cyclase (GGDEF)-like protein